MFSRLYIWFLIWLFKNIHGYTRVSVKTIYAQAVHETGNFQSIVFKENKNLFGMRLAKIRDNLATGERHFHATYSSWYNSIRDYFKRQKYFSVPNLAGNGYISKTVSTGYAEDPSYEAKWRNWVDRLKNGFFDNVFYVAFFYTSDVGPGCQKKKLIIDCN